MQLIAFRSGPARTSAPPWRNATLEELLRRSGNGLTDSSGGGWARSAVTIIVTMATVATPPSKNPSFAPGLSLPGHIGRSSAVIAPSLSCRSGIVSATAGVGSAGRGLFAVGTRAKGNLRSRVLPFSDNPRPESPRFVPLFIRSVTKDGHPNDARTAGTGRWALFFARAESTENSEWL